MNPPLKKCSYQVWSPYGPDELSVLIHSYLELRTCSSSFVRVRLMDVSRCFKMLSWNEAQALFLIGVCKLTSRETGALLGMSHTHAITNHNNGKINLLGLMNGVQPLINR